MTSKGKYGLPLTAIAALAFGFCALRQPLAVLLIAGFALLAEGDQWLNRQAVQAVLLAVTYAIAALVNGWVFGGLARLFGEISFYRAQDAMLSVDALLDTLLYVGLIVLCLLAIVRVLRGQDAALPLLTKMADGDFTAAFAKKTMAPPAVPATPMQATTATTPSPESATPQAEPDTGHPCPSCGAPLRENAQFCTECGAKTN